ncbi:MAG: hypothetical protein KGJ80_14990, partial [Chloroflexota bacterium]|nr:hypothetical protein [Chloroflexota bacterium]
NLGEFKKISFFIGVGEKDNRAIEVPRGFDTYVGTTRVERAQTFHRALQDLGMRSTLVVFPNAGHEISGEMHARVVRFLKDNAPVNTLRR